jgi:hypothetical protein
MAHGVCHQTYNIKKNIEQHDGCKMTVHVGQLLLRGLVQDGHKQLTNACDLSEQAHKVHEPLLDLILATSASVLSLVGHQVHHSSTG